MGDGDLTNKIKKTKKMNDDEKDGIDGNDLHPSTGEDDEDDGGVAEDGCERDRAVEQGDHYHLAQLVKM